MKGAFITAAGFACAFGCALYFRSFPPDVSQGGLKNLRRALLLAASSLVLLSVICEIIFFGKGWGFAFHRGVLFWLIFTELLINGIAVYSLLSPLIGLLPFSKRDADEITPVGLSFGIALGLIEALLFFLGFVLMISE